MEKNSDLNGSKLTEKKNPSVILNKQENTKLSSREKRSTSRNDPISDRTPRLQVLDKKPEHLDTLDRLSNDKYLSKINSG